MRASRSREGDVPRTLRALWGKPRAWIAPGLAWLVSCNLGGASAALASPSFGLIPTPVLDFVPCFQAEGFLTIEHWNQTREQWQRQQPRIPSPRMALRGWRVVREWSDFAIHSLPSDKGAHCYLGCRIAQVADLTTARYAAWEKERRDLSDCQSKTHFEEADFTATMRGAQIGLESRSEVDCLAECRQQFSN
ncbi:MAG: hypothetical protein RJB38_763 [Pseudomonadota bacterium]|jgi:hypothetical protein